MSKSNATVNGNDVDDWSDDFDRTGFVGANGDGDRVGHIDGDYGHYTFGGEWRGGFVDQKAAEQAYSSYVYRLTGC